eukprot:gb/GEZN01001076.1/.p1 GENE.gb/GEZN01001076.1/~~gb/GEZN01001076.1/.p1  ORF type:complete len:985 (+),score=118.61 gb/GEZN01001076.1/:108-3062(+)
MEGEIEYRIVPRKGFMDGFPTDFLVLQFQGSAADDRIEWHLAKLRTNAMVKLVMEDTLRREGGRGGGEEEDEEETKKIRVEEGEEEGKGKRQEKRRRLLRFGAGGGVGNMLTTQTGASVLWKEGVKGQGIKLAIFDSGLDANSGYLKNVKDRTSWVGTADPKDEVGHGTSVAGIAAGTHPDCLGMAPEIEIFAYKIFNKQRMTYTSWYLDAVNHAILSKVDVANLSLGGPDWNDYVFVAKSREVSANGIVLVSAIGNDGPSYGTLYNPGDQSDAIGVGSINWDGSIANFQSRGMTIWELPDGGYGRIKPDIVTFGSQIRSARGMGCSAMSGTSASSPVVAGAVCLLASAIPANMRKFHLNPAVLKQVLVETAEPLPRAHIHEQGNGKMDLPKAYQAIKNYKLHASVVPDMLDLTQCPRFWPYCQSPLYYTRQPQMLNLTLLNPASVSGFLVSFKLTVDSQAWDGLLDIQYEIPPRIWPYSSYLGLRISTSRDVPAAMKVTGHMTFVVRPDLPEGDSRLQDYPAMLRFAMNVVTKPKKEKRLLWDQVHNRGYPGGFIPNDSHGKAHSLDLSGDHIHTNFRQLFNWASEKGYMVEVLSKRWNTLDLSQYAVLLMFDPEADFLQEEIVSLQTHIANGLSLFIMAGWYSLDAVKKLIFFDDETQTYWLPRTGGCNIPALNDLLEKYGIGFGDQIFQGKVTLGTMNSGAALRMFPKGGFIGTASLRSTEQKTTQNEKAYVGLVDGRVLSNLLNCDPAKCGKILVHGDASCAEGSTGFCSDFLQQGLQWLVATSHQTQISGMYVTPSQYLDRDLVAPVRPPWSPRNFDPNQSIGPPRPDPLLRPPGRTSQSTSNIEPMSSQEYARYNGFPPPNLQFYSNKSSSEEDLLTRKVLSWLLMLIVVLIVFLLLCPFYCKNGLKAFNSSLLFSSSTAQSADHFWRYLEGNYSTINTYTPTTATTTAATTTTTTSATTTTTSLPYSSYTFHSSKLK